MEGLVDCRNLDLDHVLTILGIIYRLLVDGLACLVLAEE